jgi:hypothetical protein
MKEIIFALACVLLLAVVSIAIASVWWRRQWRRELDRDAFSGWLGRVEAILRQFGKHADERTPAQWRADYDAGLSPIAAASALLDRIPGDARNLKFKIDPKTSNCVSTSWKISSQ